MTPDDARRLFTDPALRDAAVETGPVFAAFTARLNAISQDIKNLEQHLSQATARVTAAVAMSEAEALMWRLGEPDAWRIVYFNKTEEFMKPLIECPVDVRVRARRFLPALLRAVAEVANSGNNEPPRSDS